MKNLGVFAQSLKPDEKRIPIHPLQIEEISENIRKNLFFEEGYGASFDIEDQFFTEKTGGVRSREALMQDCDILLLAKPSLEDFLQMPNGKIHWGWPHCVQQEAITQAAIDRNLTLIAWEAMHSWSQEGQWQMHTFHKNNEIAGYAGVHHAMNLMGIDGNYGRSLSAAVFSFGSVSQGAIKGLNSRGVNDIIVYLPENVKMAGKSIPSVRFKQFKSGPNGKLLAIENDQNATPIIEELSSADVIVNGILQDTDAPLMFVDEDDVNKLKYRCLIIDISCDEGMGFSFAKPTSFNDPIFKVGSSYYYAVDHTPSYYWDAASWEISKSLIPYLPVVMGGPAVWNENETIKRAIEIMEGRIQNPKILSFQNRNEQYPYEVNNH